MLKNYIKIAFKIFRRRKFFTFVSLFGITFTLMVLMVAAAIFDNMFAASSPESNQDRTLSVTWTVLDSKNGTMWGEPGYAFLTKFVKTLPDVEMVSAFTPNEAVTSFKDGYEVKLQIKRTDGEFWKILDFHFMEGRPLTTEDDANANLVAVINQATKEKFFGVESAMGRYITVGRQRFLIVGVVANVPEYHTLPFADIWVPLSTWESPNYRTRVIGGCNGLILAHSAADFDRIRSEFDALLPRVPLPNSRYTDFLSVTQTHFELVAGSLPTSNLFDRNSTGPRDNMKMLSQNPEKFLVSLAIATALFMLLPALNLISLNISRIMERSSEIGVRKAFGASKRTLVGQFLVENLLLTSIGGVLGFFASLVLLHILSNAGIFAYAEFPFNARVFLYGFAALLFFGMMSGIYPAWRMARMHPVKALSGSRA